MRENTAARHRSHYSSMLQTVSTEIVFLHEANKVLRKVAAHVLAATADHQLARLTGQKPPPLFVRQRDL